MLLDSKVVIVTGAASPRGIGKATAKALAAQGARVVILDLRTPEEYQADGAKIPGAIWFDRKELEERHLEIPRDRDVVLYCT